jgi:hypothetical protein
MNTLHHSGGVAPTPALQYLKRPKKMPINKKKSSSIKKDVPKKVTKPRFRPTEDEYKVVETMAAIGIPQDDIASVIRGGIATTTLRKHFRKTLDTAMTKANAMVGGALYNKAINGDVTAQIFWCKTRMGWKETNVNVNLDATIEIQEELDGIYEVIDQVASVNPKFTVISGGG